MGDGNSGGGGGKSSRSGTRRSGTLDGKPYNSNSILTSILEFYVLFDLKGDHRKIRPSTKDNTYTMTRLTLLCHTIQRVILIGPLRLMNFMYQKEFL